MPEILQSFADRNRKLAGAFEQYMIRLSPQTRRAYRDAVGRLVEMLESQSVLEVTRIDIREFQSQLLERGLSDASLNLHTSALKKFYEFLQVGGLMRVDPTLRLERRKIPARLQRLLTVEEIERLIAACQTPFERALVEVLYATAVRVSEAVNIRLEQINFASQILTVRKGKGGKDRIVPFGEHARAALCAHLGERAEGFLFEHGGKPYHTDRIRQVVREVAVRAHVRGVSPHAFRRAAGTHLLQHGADLRAVQEYLGHEDLSTTARCYTLLQCSDLQRVYEKAHPHAKGSSDESTSK